jgi:heme exporter protein D
MSPAIATAIASLGASALELLPDFIAAVKADRRLARDIAEEMARREAFEARQRAKSVKK